MANLAPQFGRLVRHIWVAVAKNLTSSVAVGTMIALTGFGPEHWFAAAFRYVEMPQAGLVWPSWLDIRGLIVSGGGRFSVCRDASSRAGVALVARYSSPDRVGRRRHRGGGRACPQDAPRKVRDRASGRRSAIAAVGPGDPDTAIPTGRGGPCR